MGFSSAIVVAVCCLAYVAAAPARVKRQNYEALLQNKAYVEAQIKCVLQEGPCDRIGQRIKTLLPEAIKQQTCPNDCTDEEKGYVPRIHDLVRTKYPNDYSRIKTIYAKDVDVPDDLLLANSNDNDSAGDKDNQDTQESKPTPVVVNANGSTPSQQQQQDAKGQEKVDDVKESDGYYNQEDDGEERE